MKKYLVVFFVLSTNVFANLYLTTSYQETKRSKPVVTKHHLFLNQPYLIKYEKIRYNLKLVKIEKNEFVTIETESLLPGKKRFEVVAGGVLQGSIKKPMFIKPPANENEFYLKLIFEKIVNGN